MVNFEEEIEKRVRALYHESLLKFLIIKNPPKFPEDKDSVKICSGCNSNCCFFGASPDIDTLGRERNPFLEKEKILEYYQSSEEREKMEFILEKGYFIDWNDKARLRLNANWPRVYEIEGVFYVEFACPFLSLRGCSIYPSRFNPLCTSFGKNRCEKRNINIAYEKIIFDS